MNLKYNSLSELFTTLHRDMTVYPKWKAPLDVVQTVLWKPWGIWEATGYTGMKLNLLTKRYITLPQLEMCKARVQKGVKQKEVSAVALNLGHNAGEASPLRYQMGQCMCTVVFRISGGVIRPLIVWRTVEITRRWIADLVFLNQVFNFVLDGLVLGPVDMMMNVLWFADFNVALAGVWMPNLRHITPQNLQSRFNIREGKQAYRARDISWKLAEFADPLYTSKFELLKECRKSDFPEGPWGGKYTLEER